MSITRYLLKTARGYFRAQDQMRPTADTQWTRFAAEAHQWVDADACHSACRRYTATSGEGASVVVHVLNHGNLV
jgi:hypothetical protein